MCPIVASKERRSIELPTRAVLSSEESVGGFFNNEKRHYRLDQDIRRRHISKDS